jgi:hypothetical protein
MTSVDEEQFRRLTKSLGAPYLVRIDADWPSHDEWSIP